MEPAVIVAVLAAFFVAAFLKGVTGLGFSTICLGLVASLVPIKTAIPLVLIASLSSNVLVMVEARRFREAIARFWPLYAAALPGIGIGLWLLAVSHGDGPRLALGLVLLVYGVWGLANLDFAIPATSERWLSAPVGFLTGLVNGVTGSQVMPVLPYLLALRIERNLFVQTINVSFTASSLVMLAGLGGIGLLSVELLAISAVGIVPVAIGIRLGGRVRRRLPEARFRQAVLGLLVVLGAALAARSVL